MSATAYRVEMIAMPSESTRGGDAIWTLAKDGADVPPSLRTVRPARQQIGVGETYDFELAPMTPRADGLWLELRRGSGEFLIQMPLRVK